MLERPGRAVPEPGRWGRNTLLFAVFHHYELTG
jgi:hypothetical protein